MVQLTSLQHLQRLHTWTPFCIAPGQHSQCGAWRYLWSLEHGKSLFNCTFVTITVWCMERLMTRHTRTIELPSRMFCTWNIQNKIEGNPLWTEFSFSVKLFFFCKCIPKKWFVRSSFRSADLNYSICSLYQRVLTGKEAEDPRVLENYKIPARIRHGLALWISCEYVVVPATLQYLKGHGNEADFLGFLQKLGPHRYESESRRLPDSANRGVANSPTWRVGESLTPWLRESGSRHGESGSRY